MYVLLFTEINGSDKVIIGAMLTVNDMSHLTPNAAWHQVELTDLPVDFETFSNNFEKYQVTDYATTPVVELQSGETLGDRVLSTIDTSIPMALERANQATIFQNL